MKRKGGVLYIQKIYLAATDDRQLFLDFK